MGVKEYKYLTDALKGEILILRGDLKKSNIPIHIVTDKKLLAFLPQDLVAGEGGSSLQESILIDSSKPLSTTSSSSLGSNKGNINVRKRISLLNLDEDEMILKYCELRAKYDNLIETSSQKIYELTTESSVKMDTVEDKENSKLIIQKEKELIEKYEIVLNEKDKVINDLKATIKDLTAENESKQEMVNLNVEDINYLTERVEKHSNIIC